MMEENKKRLGKLIEEESGQEIELESVFVGRFVGNRRVCISKTELGTYLIDMRRDGENEPMEKPVYMTREMFSALFCSMLQFLEKEGEDFKEFLEASCDENSRFLYKSLDNLKDGEG